MARTIPKLVHLSTALGPKGAGGGSRDRTRVLESEVIDPMMDAAWKQWGNTLAKALPALIKAQATPARRPQRRGAGFRKPRGFWPRGRGPGRRSANRFKVTGKAARESGGKFRYMVLSNPAPQARALEAGAYYTVRGRQLRRPKGGYLKRLYNRRIKPEAVEIAGREFPDTVEARFRRRRSVPRGR